MSASTILNADMATLLRWAQTGWAWWIDELRAMVPPTLARRMNHGGDIVAMADGDGGFTLTRRGQPAVLDPARPVAAALALPRDACLMRQLRLPVLSRADLGRMMAYDLDRLMPFPAGSALVAVEPGAVDGDGHQHVTVAALPRGYAQAQFESAARCGIDVRRMGVGRPGALRFDFLPALRAGTTPAGISPARRWWAVVALLFGLNLALLVGRDVQSLRNLDALVTAHGATATLAAQLRARVLAEDAARRSWILRRAATDPLAMLSEVTRALPDGAWVQRLSWDGARLRLTGFKRGDVDVIAALRHTPHFAQARAASSEIATKQSVGEPFDITADTGPDAAPEAAR